MKRKILIVTQPEITSRVGGAITMFCFLANHFQSKGYDVQGVCNSGISGRPEQLLPEIPLHNLYEQDGSAGNFGPKIKILIRGIQPDCIIFFFHYLYIDAGLGHEFDNIPKIITFHSRPDFYFAIHPWAKRKMRPLYRNTTAQILFDSFRDLLPRFIRKGRVVTIPNPVQGPDVTRDFDKCTRRIIFLSRIDRMKGVDIMIKAFGEVYRSHPDWSLDIWGEFESEQLHCEYVSLAGKCGVSDGINFRGVTKTPVKTLCDYDFCIFPSLFEGFGIGLAESLKAGLPCIGLKKCSGVNEIIEDGVNGFLCDETPEDMARKINLLIENPSLLKRMSEEALRVRERFDENHIKWLWDNLVEDCINHKNRPELFPVKKLLQ